MALGRIGQSQRRRLIPRRQPLTTASATGRIPPNGLDPMTA